MFVGNSSNVNKSFTLDRKDKIKYYIRYKTHNHIALRFLNKSDVKYLIYVRPMPYIHNLLMPISHMKNI